MDSFDSGSFDSSSSSDTGSSYDSSSKHTTSSSEDSTAMRPVLNPEPTTITIDIREEVVEEESGDADDSDDDSEETHAQRRSRLMRAVDELHGRAMAAADGREEALRLAEYHYDRAHRMTDFVSEVTEAAQQKFKHEAAQCISILMVFLCWLALMIADHGFHAGSWVLGPLSAALLVSAITYTVLTYKQARAAAHKAVHVQFSYNRLRSMGEHPTSKRAHGK